MLRVCRYYCVIYCWTCCSPGGQQKNHCFVQKAAFVWSLYVDVRAHRLLQRVQLTPTLHVWSGLCMAVEGAGPWPCISAAVGSLNPSWAHLLFGGGGLAVFAHGAFLLVLQNGLLLCVFRLQKKGISNVSTTLEAFQRADTTLSLDPLNPHRKE